MCEGVRLLSRDEELRMERSLRRLDDVSLMAPLPGARARRATLAAGRERSRVGQIAAAVPAREVREASDVRCCSSARLPSAHQHPS
jgi:hypothetical protein